MVREYGMSQKLGQVYLAAEKKPLFLGVPPQETGDYSQATAEIIDQEIREAMRTQYERALAILREKREILVRGAKLLLDKEKIDGAEIRTLMAEQGVPPVGSPA